MTYNQAKKISRKLRQAGSPTSIYQLSRLNPDGWEVHFPSGWESDYDHAILLIQTGLWQKERAPLNPGSQPTKPGG